MRSVDGPSECYLRRFRLCTMYPPSGPFLVVFGPFRLTNTKKPCFLHDKVYDPSIRSHFDARASGLSEPVIWEWRYQSVPPGGPILPQDKPSSPSLLSPLFLVAPYLLGRIGAFLDTDAFYRNHAREASRSFPPLLSCAAQREHQWRRLLPYPPCGHRHVLR